MADLNTALAVEVLFEKAMETYEHQMQMLDLVDVFTPDPAAFQNSSNVIWRPKQQHAPDQGRLGFDRHVWGRHRGILPGDVGNSPKRCVSAAEPMTSETCVSGKDAVMQSVYVS